MSVKNVGEKYRCNICGNQVTVTKAGGGTLVCCGQEMQLLGSHEQKTVDDEIPALLLLDVSGNIWVYLVCGNTD